ncbi:DUF2334 domain-containing protein [Janthinobacterium fluminis]|uniref:DUF2334 domain-containing protein n=1 Tax=Janthinobacterium fluminis TaxID=2987524 RepID=A0ABT5JZZ3_9BURK|nr:DUF2334 domain-containing protein [Janthinobacterium fluminis]MDC8758285.1 DUF2334 domain-containing protein [Janthinobacterium fluminis]
MQRFLSALASIMLGLLFCLGGNAYASTTMNALILYDAPPGGDYEKLGLIYTIMLKNLLGHFAGTVVEMPVQNYVAGQTENYTSIFYIGSNYDNPLPAAFLQDVTTTSKTVVWFRSNIWQLAWNGAYNFTSNFGMTFTGLRGLNAAPTSTNPAPGFFDTVRYKNRDFVKYYKYNSSTGTINADPEVGVMEIVDTLKASSVVPVKNSGTGEQIPYLTRAKHLWYFADMPFTYIGPRDRYLVLADVLHDILDIDHPQSHKAMVRLEDIDALVNPANVKKLSDFLYRRHIPFSLAAIPLYMDPLGRYNGGVPRTIPLSQASNLQTALNYAISRRGEVVQHGYTHQYSNVPNPHSAVTGDDLEFWDFVHNTPLPEDSLAYAAGRIQAGMNDLLAHGYTPVAWETPHYQGSALSMRATPAIYPKTYHRAVYYTADTPDFNAAQGRDFSAGQFFPYIILKDHYGQKILPENLGNIAYDLSALFPDSSDVYSWQDIYTNAQYALAVRDGFASFFYHPFLLEPSLNLPALQDFKTLILAISALGYTWTSPSALP